MPSTITTYGDPSTPISGKRRKVRMDENGQGIAKHNQTLNAMSRVRDRLPRTHQDSWKSRIEHRCYSRDGKLVEVPEFCVRIQYRGQRDNFALGSTVAANAAMQARDIWVFLAANGWDATRAKFKPQ